MSKKTNEIVHWTIEDENKIAKAIPAIKEESGKYLLSAKSKTFIQLREQFSNRTASAFQGKVREMLKAQEHQPSDTLFSFENDQPEVNDLPATIPDAIDRILREFYGEVNYDTFLRFQNHLNKFQ